MDDFQNGDGEGTGWKGKEGEKKNRVTLSEPFYPSVEAHFLRVGRI